MSFVRTAFIHSQEKETLPKARRISHRVLFASLLFFALLPIALAGCGQTAKTITPPSSNEVHSYFTGPFSFGQSNPYGRGSVTIDHSQNAVTASVASPFDGITPLPAISGTFSASNSGFWNISESLNNNIFFSNPPLTGAWVVEIPGVGALGNLLVANNNNNQLSISPGPVGMLESSACPNFSQPVRYLFQSVPGGGSFGTVDVSSQGSAVTFQINSFSVGQSSSSTPTTSAGTGGCSNTTFGPVTAYPLNGIGTPTQADEVAISASGLFVDSSRGAAQSLFGGASALGVTLPALPLDTNALVSAHYSGFMLAPNDSAFVNPPFDLTTLASSFGDDTPASPACSTLMSSLNSLSSPPSAFSLFGGEYPNNNPTQANATENCDVVIDLGVQDAGNNGMYSNAKVFIGSDYPFFPSDPSNPPPPPPAGAYPAVAIAAQMQGRYVIFVSTNAGLPNASGFLGNQSFGIYLFQKSQ